MKRIAAFVLTALLAFAASAQVTTNPDVTGVPQPQSAVAITGGTISGVTLSASSITDTGLTATRVPFATTGGLLTDSAAFTFTSGTGSLGATTFVGNLTGTASAVTNATFTTSLTNNTGPGTLTWPAAGATLTIPTGGGTVATTTQLPAQTTNTLWTPTANVVTFTSASGKYSTFGPIVVVNFDVTWPSTTDTGDAKINNLPVAAIGAITCAIGYSTNSNPTTLNGSAATSLIFYLFNGNAVTNAVFSTTRIIGSCTYASA